MNVDTDFKSKRNISRRDFLKLLRAVGVSVFMGSYVSVLEPTWWDVTDIHLTLPRLPKSFSGFRLVQLSDIHLGGWTNIEHLKSIFEIVRGLSPNLVAITGDFVLDPGRTLVHSLNLDDYEVALKSLTAYIPVLAVLGNHDYWFDYRVVLKMLESSGVQVLINSAQKVQIADEFIWFGGIDDMSEGVPKLERVLKSLSNEACSILLAHEPDFADESAATGYFDLQISGHSHGGQVNLPLVGPPVLPRFGQKYPSGLYQVGQMYQYTNRGIGMTPPYVRLNCRPEITVFTLESV